MKRVLLALTLVLFAVSPLCADMDEKIGLGEPAPNATIDKPLSPEDYLHLGLDSDTVAFNLNDIKGDVLVLELFNRFCLSCLEQAAHMQSLWEELGAEGLRDRVKLLALGQGNSARGVSRFRSDRKLTYPIAADPNFTAIDAFGDPGGTPLSLFMLRDAGSWLLVDYHLGKMKDTLLLAGVKRLLTGDTAPFADDKGTSASQHKAAPELSKDEKEQLLASIFKKAVGRAVEAREITLADGTTLFQAIDPDTGPLDIFVRIAKRHPVCDLCHTNTFAFAFNTGGKILAFQPLYVTKKGNANWSAEDIAGFKSRLVGKKMTTLTFDSEVDAVTGASMSSALIYDEIRKTTAMLKELGEVAP